MQNNTNTLKRGHIIEITKNLKDLKLPRWSDLPSVDLYLEQVLRLLDEWLGGYLDFDGKKIMTRTMVNNYVKHNYIDAPENKKYNRDNIAYLFVIAILKPVYTIEDISRLINLTCKANGIEASFDLFCELIEEAVQHAFSRTTMQKVSHEEDPRDLFWNVCNSFACQLYVRYIYLQKS